jgi:mRNA-degrading endonuclease YafQ of YafQ-DinJ toxin-antitoxin module
MTAPPFSIFPTPEFNKQLTRIAKSNATKHKKVLKTIRLLRDVGPRHPGLNAHKYQSLTGPDDRDLWEVYVENKTPGAWRLWWCYGPDPDAITLVTVGPHP